MLVLTRKVGERLFLGDETIVSVNSIERDRARIGFLASPDVLILREEIQQSSAPDKQPIRPGFGAGTRPGMLVLTRRPGEGVVIGRTTRLSILQIQKDRVRIGITAPADLRVLREELRKPPRPAPEVPEVSPASYESGLWSPETTGTSSLSGVTNPEEPLA